MKPLASFLAVLLLPVLSGTERWRNVSISMTLATSCMCNAVGYLEMRTNDLFASRVGSTFDRRILKKRRITFNACR